MVAEAKKTDKDRLKEMASDVSKRRSSIGPLSVERFVALLLQNRLVQLFDSLVPDLWESYREYVEQHQEDLSELIMGWHPEAVNGWNYALRTVLGCDTLSTTEEFVRSSLGVEGARCDYDREMAVAENLLQVWCDDYVSSILV